MRLARANVRKLVRRPASFVTFLLLLGPAWACSTSR